MIISVIGTGKLSWQVTQALFGAGHDIQQVFSRKLSNASKLATKVDAEPIDSYIYLKSSEVLVIAVSDDHIEEVAMGIPTTYRGIIVHTSGATSLDVLSRHHKRTGVFYPLFSFPTKRRRSMKPVPFLISAWHESDSQILYDLATTISKSVYSIADEHRIQLHLSAIYANNFSNFMMTKAFDICEIYGLNKNILLPIIKQGSHKWQKGLSKNHQTGPAMRGDAKTMTKHHNIIKDQADRELYILISQHIEKYYR